MLQFHTVDVILQVGKRTVYNGIRKEKKRQSDRAIRSGAGLYSSESIKPDRMASPPTHFTSTWLSAICRSTPMVRLLFFLHDEC